MKLTKLERLNFVNQYKILEALYPEEAKNYAAIREAIENGYALHYEDLFQHIYEEVSLETCSEVLDILDMYTALYYSWGELESPKKLQLKDVVFPGFDGNHETAHLGYMRYFVLRLERYSYIKDSVTEHKKGLGHNSFNSHMRYLPTYRAMLETFSKYKRTQNKMTEEQIKEILQSRGDFSGI